MTDGDVQAHPVVAALAASLQRDGTRLWYPQEALDKTRAALRAAGRDDTIARNLIVLGIKTHRIAGAAAEPLLIELAILVAESLGSAQAAADGFANAGLARDVAARIGAQSAARAPEEKKPPAPAVRARRGLS